MFGDDSKHIPLVDQTPTTICVKSDHRVIATCSCSGDFFPLKFDPHFWGVNLGVKFLGCQNFSAIRAGNRKKPQGTHPTRPHPPPEGGLDPPRIMQFTDWKLESVAMGVCLLDVCCRRVSCTWGDVPGRATVECNPGFRLKHRSAQPAPTGWAARARACVTLRANEMLRPATLAKPPWRPCSSGGRPLAPPPAPEPLARLHFENTAPH